MDYLPNEIWCLIAEIGGILVRYKIACCCRYLHTLMITTSNREKPSRLPKNAYSVKTRQVRAYLNSRYPTVKHFPFPHRPYREPLVHRHKVFRSAKSIDCLMRVEDNVLTLINMGMLFEWILILRCLIYSGMRNIDGYFQVNVEEGILVPYYMLILDVHNYDYGMCMYDIYPELVDCNLSRQQQVVYESSTVAANDHHRRYILSKFLDDNIWPNGTEFIWLPSLGELRIAIRMN